MKSKQKLFRFLQLLSKQPYVGLSSQGISNETYGKRSMIYIHAPSFGFERRVLEHQLSSNGYKVNFNYWPESQNTEVQVSYFKGKNWDE